MKKEELSENNINTKQTQKRSFRQSPSIGNVIDQAGNTKNKALNRFDSFKQMIPTSIRNLTFSPMQKVGVTLLISGALFWKGLCNCYLVIFYEKFIEFYNTG